MNTKKRSAEPSIYLILDKKIPVYYVGNRQRAKDLTTNAEDLSFKQIKHKD